MTALLPGPGIEMEICLGLGNTAQDGVWDTGRWDVNSWGNPDTSLGDWVDVSCSVVDKGVVSSRPVAQQTGWSPAGKRRPARSSSSATEYDPRSGPWAGIIGPSLPIRVRWRPVGSPTWLTTFIGFVDDGGFDYDPMTHLSAVAATDGTRLLAAFDGIEQAPQGTGETAAARVTRIADLAHWPLDRRDITPGGVTLKSTTLADNAWSMELAVADTDLALLWLSRDGKLSYCPQAKVLPARQVSAAVSCDPDAVAGVPSIRPLNIVGQQPNITRNIVSISRQKEDDGLDGVTATVQDETSIARFLPHTYSRTDLLHQDDAWSVRIAEEVLASSAWPSTAPEKVELDSRADHAATALLLALEPSLSIAVDDGADIWQCEPSGWSVTVYRTHVEGEIILLDVTRYRGGAWDDAKWDDSEWGF